MIFNDILSMSFGFWLSLGVLVLVGLNGWSNRYRAFGIPVLAVCGTVILWYHGDAVYNDYWENHAVLFKEQTLWNAWTQVMLFGISLAFLTPIIHRKVNRRLLGQRSNVSQLLDGRETLDRMQLPIQRVFSVFLSIWLVLTLMGLYRTGFDFQGMFAPYLGYKANPWARGRMGGGIDALFALAQYVNLFCLAGFGITAVLTKNSRIRTIAIILVMLSWPSVFVDRTRNTMLAVALPSLLALVFLKFRGKFILQVATMILGFMAIESWFSYVIETRSVASIASALQKEETEEEGEGARHLGLNMYEELCWINQFIDNGRYEITYGDRYFAELVNPIPRALWPGKPLIGIDYAKARGQGGGTEESAGVFATISTGMIGQGVVNFGKFFGPIAAAALMGLWCSLLAKFDLMGIHPGRLALYLLGLVLTVNMGRDITLLVAYPLIFGYIAIRITEYMAPKRTG